MAPPSRPWLVLAGKAESESPRAQPEAGRALLLWGQHCEPAPPGPGKLPNRVPRTPAKANPPANACGGKGLRRRLRRAFPFGGYNPNPLGPEKSSFGAHKLFPMHKHLFPAIVLMFIANAISLMPTVLIDSTYRDASCSPLQAHSHHHHVCLARLRSTAAATPLA